MTEDDREDFRVNVAWLDGVAVVALFGEWDLYSKERLHDAMSAVGASHDIVIDVRGASFFDSSALGELITFYKRVRERGKQLEVVAGSSNMERLLELTGLRNVLVPPPDRLAYLQEHLPIPQRQERRQ